MIWYALSCGSLKHQTFFWGLEPIAGLWLASRSSECHRGSSRYVVCRILDTCFVGWQLSGKLKLLVRRRWELLGDVSRLAPRPAIFTELLVWWNLQVWLRHLSTLFLAALWEHAALSWGFQASSWVLMLFHLLSLIQSRLFFCFCMNMMAIYICGALFCLFFHLIFDAAHLFWEAESFCDAPDARNTYELNAEICFNNTD